MLARVGVLQKKRGNFVLQERFAGARDVIDTTDSEVAHHESALAAAGYLTCRIKWGPRFKVGHLSVRDDGPCVC